MLGNHRMQKVIKNFLQKKTNIFYGAKMVFRLFATFFGLTIFSSGGKGFTLLSAGQFETRLQEFGLWTS